MRKQGCLTGCLGMLFGALVLGCAAILVIITVINMLPSGGVPLLPLPGPPVVVHPRPRPQYTPPTPYKPRQDYPTPYPFVPMPPTPPQPNEDTVTPPVGYRPPHHHSNVHEHPDLPYKQDDP